MYLDRCINYSESPIQFRHRSYVYLYETTNLCTGDIYIGVRVYRGSDPYSDEYIGNGCGVYKNGKLYKRKGKETKFRRALSKYGYVNFKKRIICFFYTIDDALASEQAIVDSEFLKRPDVLNMVEGGGFPPYGIGEENSNYGHRWTEEMKAELSKKRKKNGKSKGGRNPKAKRSWAYDLWTGEWVELEYVHQLRLIDPTIKRASWYKIRSFRWVVLPNKVEDQELDFIIKSKFQEKYQKTYVVFKNLMEGKSEEDIVKMGYTLAHIHRLKNKYVKNYKH